MPVLDSKSLIKPSTKTNKKGHIYHTQTIDQSDLKTKK